MTRIVASILILLTAGVFICASLDPVDDFRLHYSYTDFFSEKWQDDPDGKPLSENYVSVGPDETVYLYHVLPYAISPDEAIAIYDPGMYIAVYANGTFLGDFGKGTDDVLGKEVGNSWFIINIPLFAQGKILTLEIKNPTSKNVRFYFSYALFGQHNDLNNEIFIKNMSAFLNGLMFIIVGIILVIFTFFLFKYKIESMKVPAAYMSIVSILSGIWFLVDSNLPQFISGSVSARYSVSFFLLLVLPIYLLMFFMEYLDRDKKLIKILLCIYIAIMALVVLLYATGLVHISISFRIILAYLFVVLLFLLVLLQRKLFQD